MSKGSILFVLTSADKLLNGAATGWYLPEAAHPYYALKDEFEIIFASPKGGEAPLDQNSVKMFTDDESVKFLNDPSTQQLYKNTRKLSEVDAKDFKAIFVVGGHGPLIDLAQDTTFAKLVDDIYAANKPVAAVCHGPAALVLSKRPDGTSILKDTKYTVFTNSEEAQTPYNDFVNILPFSPQEKMSALGGILERTDDWGVKVVWDKGLLTGQNPASAGALGEKLKEILLAQ